MQENLQNLIADGQTEEVLIQLRQKLRKGLVLQQVIQLSNRWSILQQKLISKAIHDSEADIEHNRINHALLYIIEQIDDQSLKNRTIYWTWLLGGITTISLLALSYAGSYWFTTPFKLSVSVVGEDGQHSELLSGKARLKIIHSEEDEADIGNDGIAHFKNIPANFRRDSIRISIIRTHSVSFEGDSTYKIGFNSFITLRVYPWKWDVVVGNIRDAQTLSPLDSVRVVFRDLVALTNRDGYFELHIPKEKQRQEVPLMVIRDGYETKTGKAYPQTEAPFEVFLNKVKRYPPPQ